MARVWNRQKVIAVLRAYHAHGLSPSFDEKQLACLRGAAKRYFGNWRNAVLAAGLTPTTRKHWSAKRVLEAIQEAFPDGISEEDNRAGKELLVSAACRYFGSWRKALVAAGVLGSEDTIPRLRKWTTKRLIECLQDAYVQGTPMVTTQFTGVASIASRRFGSWEAALKAAGISAGSSAEPCEHWTANKVLREIQVWHTEKETNLPLYRFHPGLTEAARRYFGSWRRAKIASQVFSNLLPRQQNWSPGRVLREIKARQQQSLSLHANDPRNHRLCDAARRYFGNWRTALLTAGIPGVPAPRQKRTNAEVIAAIKVWKTGPRADRIPTWLQCAMYRLFGSAAKAHVAAGLPPGNLKAGSKPTWNAARVLKAIRTWKAEGKDLRKVWKECGGLYLQAKKHFGSWRQALAVAGIPDDPLRIRQKRCQAVLEDLRAWAQQSPSLSSKRAPRKLVPTAYYYWGDWHNALVAAGIKEQDSPAKKCRRWDRQKVLTAIQARQQQGLRLNSIYQEDMGLYIQSRKYFGSWQQAVLAAADEPRQQEAKAKKKRNPRK